MRPGSSSGGVEGDRVDERPLCAVGVDGEQHGMLLLGRAAHEELPVPPPGRPADDAGTEQLGQPSLQELAAGELAEPASKSRVLGGGPLLRGGAPASSSQR
jgi:hypothetical protein